MTKTLDDDTVAAHPGGFALSTAKLKSLQPDLYGPFAWIGWDWEDGKLSSRRSFWLTRIEEQLLFGDTRAAVVLTTSPLLIAAYTDEIDCVVLLRFSNRFVSEYDLKPGSRLITINTYVDSDGSYESDLKPGPEARDYYENFHPFIADFLTDDVERLAQRKLEISEDEWRRTEELGHTYLSENYARPRDGRPCWSILPAERLPSDLQDIEPKKPTPVTILEIPKRIMFVLVFIPLTAWGFVEYQRNPRMGLFGIAVFGTMLLLSMVALIRLPRDLKTRAGIKEVHSVRGAYMWTVTLGLSFILAFAGKLIFEALNGFWPNIAIWLSSFLANLAFYPFRGQMKEDYPTFGPWAILSGVMGILSLVLAHIFNWLELGG
jgi:hypothetical protein